jgi:hypothetical protein
MSVIRKVSIGIIIYILVFTKMLFVVKLRKCCCWWAFCINTVRTSKKVHLKSRPVKGYKLADGADVIGRTIVTRQWLKPLLSDTKLDGTFTHYYYPAAAVSLVVEQH